MHARSMEQLRHLAESGDESMQNAETQHEIQMAMDTRVQVDARVQLNILGPDWPALECANCSKGAHPQLCALALPSMLTRSRRSARGGSKLTPSPRALEGRCKKSCPSRHRTAESQMRLGVRELCEEGKLWSALRLVHSFVGHPMFQDLHITTESARQLQHDVVEVIKCGHALENTSSWPHEWWHTHAVFALESIRNEPDPMMTAPVATDWIEQMHRKQAPVFQARRHVCSDLRLHRRNVAHSCCPREPQETYRKHFRACARALGQDPQCKTPPANPNALRSSTTVLSRPLA